MNRNQLKAHKRSHTKENSYWLYDAKSIPVSRVCHCCLHDTMRRFNPEVFDDQKYEDVVVEVIDPDHGGEYGWDFGAQ